MRPLLLAALALAGCHRAPTPDTTPGGRLEAAAVARGLVSDPARVGIVGAWASETDRLCVLPARGTLRLGAVVDYGEGQACAASGTVERQGNRLRVRFADCVFDAGFDGERITFPAALPGGCARFCQGRASLAALAVERLSESISEAQALRGPDGRLLCTD